jgi:hypothetical protein
MKTASKLLSAAFAIAAIASVAMPMAQPAAAASGPDMIAIIQQTHLDSAGGMSVYGVIRNDGDTKSAVTNVVKYCGYLAPLTPQPNLQVKWIAVAVNPPTVIPALNGGNQADVKFNCTAVDGLRLVAARVDVTSAGDVKPSNNSLRQWAYELN